MSAAGISLAGAAGADAACAHCAGPVPAGARFCCAGCAGAYEMVQAMGLGAYYARRELDPAAPPTRPEAAQTRDLAAHVRTTDGTAEAGTQSLSLAIDGLHCGACVWLIESVLARAPELRRARVNLTARRLDLTWQGAAADAARLLAPVMALGYRLAPYDARALAAAEDAAGQRLMRALAVAGFAAGNVMLMSIGVWSGLAETMGPATRALMHWVSALIAMPAIAYAGMPFFASAARALRHGRTNMDVPISVGVALVTAMSLWETLAGGQHTYFDSAAALVFFLLVGRVLDHKARGAARESAARMLALRAADVTVLDEAGAATRRAAESVAVGARVLVGMGERVGVDGVVETGQSSLDNSLVSGESLPAPAGPGSAVFAGTLNLGAPLILRVTATGEGTLLAECARLMEAAEARRGRYVTLADRVARAYAPVVHALALLTFLFWVWVGEMDWQPALLIAAAVLIITCPCALALAVPAAQVIATGLLFRAGILLKSATALERLARVNMVVFDKTGTLTEPDPALEGKVDAAALRAAAPLAAASRHPLARALLAAAQAEGPVLPAAGVVEHPGQGLALAGPSGTARLGSRAFCGIAEDGAEAEAGPELWFTRPGHAPARFSFRERARVDAAESVARIRRMGISVHLLSGDRAGAVARIAAEVGIADWEAGQSPADKAASIAALAEAGRTVLMVGDGLNDGPALAAATVSASPANAADISQAAADVVFQGRRLAPVVQMLETARRAERVMRENLALSLGYNVLMVPLAVAGFVTPWIAAASMSTSSLLVIANSFRLRAAGGSA